MTSPLTDQVKAKYPELPSSWLDTLWLLLQCILIGQTTNLARLKDHLPAIIDTPKAQRTKPQSHYKRLTRFFEPLVYSNTWMGYRLRQLLSELTLRIISSDRRLRGRLGKELLLDGSKWRVKGDLHMVRNPKAGLPKEDDFIFLLGSWHNRTASAAAYIHRWSIEVTFRHFKSNGFELDKVHFSDPAKREMMFAMLNVVFAMCVIEGRKFYQRHRRSQQTKKDYRNWRLNPRSLRFSPGAQPGDGYLYFTG